MKDKILLYGSIVIAVVAVALIWIYPVVAYTLLAVGLLGLIGYACFQWKWARITTFAVAFVALACGTIYCGYNLNEYYTAQGGIFGEISDIFTPNRVEAVDSLTFNFISTELKATDNPDRYAAKIVNNSPLEKLDESKIYNVFVNDVPCTLVEITSQYIRADYVYQFQNAELDEILTDTLQFRFILSPNYTEFQISTNGGSTAVKYWNSYFAMNNFIVSVKPVDPSSAGNPGITEGEVDYALANYYVKQQKWMTQLYHIGDNVNFPFPDQISTTFEGWSINGENILQEYTINKTTDFYAVESEERIYTIKYMFGEKQLSQDRVKAGNKIVKPADPKITGYSFNYWERNGEEFNFTDFVVNEDLTLNANCTAVSQNIDIVFVLKDNTQKTVLGGKVFKQSGNATVKGNGSERAQLSIPSGSDVVLYLLYNNWFTPVIDSTGLPRYIIEADEQDSTDTVSADSVEAVVDNRIAPAGAHKAFIGISNINSGGTIKILVEPIYFNIDFATESGMSTQVIAHAYGLMYGETFSVRDYMSKADYDTVRNYATSKPGTFLGWRTSRSSGNGEYKDVIFNDALIMLKEKWDDNGYYFYSNSWFEPIGSYNPETKTFLLIECWE